MRSLPVYAAVLSVLMLLPLHWLTVGLLEDRAERISELSRRQEVVVEMALEMEKFRHLSGQFRKMTDEEISAAKDAFESRISVGVAELESLAPSPEEAALGDRIREKLAALLTLCARYEPQLFLRNAYIKPDVKEVHAGVEALLADLRKSATQSLVASRTSHAAALHARRIGVYLAVGFSVLFMLMSLLLQKLTLERPLRRLATRVNGLKEGMFPDGGGLFRRGYFSEIEAAATGQALALKKQEQERKNFIEAIARDLRVPLLSLQAETRHLLDKESKRREIALRAMRRSLTLTSQILGDLTDIVEVSQGNIRLNEDVFELGELLRRTASSLRVDGASRGVQVAQPEAAIWAYGDAERLRRVVICLIRKLCSSRPEGVSIDILLRRCPVGSANGVEIEIAEEASREYPSGSSESSDTLGHWISENGFGVALARKVTAAHGGTLLVSSEDRMRFVLRLPEERIAGDSQRSEMQGEASGLRTVSLTNQEMQLMLP